jgi:hypothetical protein
MAFRVWAQKPPMGWNSWDSFATTITEEEAKEQARFMAEKLKAHGWEYIVIDAQWFEPGAKGYRYREEAEFSMDGHGRLLPAVNRFPSAAGGAGFAPLAAFIHSLGLKFGLHLMRGIPRLAVKKNLPILGTPYRAADIADVEDVCRWNTDNYGVDMSKPGAQAYYDSVFALLAEWGLDYVKVDDLSRPYLQNVREVEAIRGAIDKTGRAMVLSLSPGPTDLRAAEHAAAHANLWRISDDLWDRWLSLKESFHRQAAWNAHRVAGAWPDADMLPLGLISLGERKTRFTPEEQTTLMTLWSIGRSPLMHGGDLRKTDDFTLSLLTNDEVLAVNQRSAGNRLLWERDDIIAWTAEDPDTGDSYLALFNARDRVRIVEANARSPLAELSTTPGNGADIDADLSGGEKLILSAMPTGDGFVPVAWKAPRFVFKDGSERPLGDFAWTRADAQWDSASMKAPEGSSPAELRAMASAAIEYAIPPDAARFRARAVAERPAFAESDAVVRFLAVVGTKENRDDRPALPVEVQLADIGLGEGATVRDLWAREDLGRFEGALVAEVPFHGARLFRLRRP